jgi:predicted kinase
MAKLHLVVGPVGAGKSTFALRLCREHKAVRMNLDEWMAQLFGPDRPEDGALAWYLERSERCLAQIWTIATRILDAGGNVVAEVGLIQESDRRRFYARVEDEGIPLTVYVLDAPRRLRRERVKRRNLEQGETYSMVVPPSVFEHASDRWEPPDDAECEGRDIRFVTGASEQGE